MFHTPQILPTFKLLTMHSGSLLLNWLHHQRPFTHIDLLTAFGFDAQFVGGLRCFLPLLANGKDKTGNSEHTYTVPCIEAMEMVKVV